MANFNKVFLMGNLTRDPEMRATQSGTQIAKFGLAVNRRYSSNGNQKEETCFVDITAFGRQAEVIGQYMKKGSPIFIEGRLEFSTWQAQDGGKRSKLAVVAENFQFLGSGQQGSGQQGSGQRGGQGGGSSYGGGSASGGGDDWGDAGGYGAEGASDIPF